MKKFLILTFLAFIIIPQEAFSLTYDKKTQSNNITLSDGSSGGKIESEGFFGFGAEAPNCRKFNYKLQQIRQGQIIFYKSNGSVSGIEKGLFDCKLDKDNKPIYTIWEGISEDFLSNTVMVNYKHDEINQYTYAKQNSTWYLWTKNRDIYQWSHPNANFTRRSLTTDEIKQAESLYLFYKNVNVSSSTAKIYGDKILNNSDSVVKKESTPKKNDWINKYNDNDIIPAGSGTGFFINRDGILLSNYHVIQGCASVSLYHNGVKHSSNIIASDRTNDIAIISSSKKSNQYFRVDKDGPSLLEEIFVAGYPLGLKVSNSLKVSSGRVSSLAGFGDNYANFQLDAAINPGNSGGPIINKKGNVVGIAVAYLPSAQGFNFGIKSSTVNSFVNSNKINFSLPNMTEMSNKELSKLMNEATVFIECSMKVKDIKAAIEKEDTKKVFYSEFRN